MRANSVEGILMVAAYSVSGMPSLQSHARYLQPHGLCGSCISSEDVCQLQHCKSAETSGAKHCQKSCMSDSRIVMQAAQWYMR